MSVPEVVAGRYHLLRLAGRGGMAEVWIAQDRQLDRTVAVKIMAKSLSEEANMRERFLREAQAAAKIQSPYVVQVLDFGSDADTLFMVMELLVGEDLGSRLARVKKLSPTEASRLLAQTARGLKKAHDLGYVHRDIKPANLFLAQGDDGEQVKILDFGIVRSLAGGQPTITKGTIGSPRYMSPEQVQGAHNVDPRADIWSVGAVLFEALTAVPPFRGRAYTEVLISVCTKPHIPPSSLDPTLAPLDPVFDKCFQKDPTQRFQTIGELATAFAAAVGGPSTSSDFDATPMSGADLRMLRRTVPISANTGSNPAIAAPASMAKQADFEDVTELVPTRLVVPRPLLDELRAARSAAPGQPPAAAAPAPAPSPAASTGRSLVLLFVGVMVAACVLTLLFLLVFTR